jgi:hypothetical protein
MKEAQVSSEKERRPTPVPFNSLNQSNLPAWDFLRLLRDNLLRFLDDGPRRRSPGRPRKLGRARDRSRRRGRTMHPSKKEPETP